MPTGIAHSPSLGIHPRLPVWIRWVNGEPIILAGGVPVIPFNTALRHCARHDGATRKSLAAYARAGALYATYCAHQGVGLLDITNDEFPLFVDGLLGRKFRNASGEFVHLDGHARSRASADLYLTLLYSLTGDVAHLYDVSFDWRRYRRRSDGPPRLRSRRGRPTAGQPACADNGCGRGAIGANRVDSTRAAGNGKDESETYICNERLLEAETTQMRQQISNERFERHREPSGLHGTPTGMSTP